MNEPFLEPRYDVLCTDFLMQHRCVYCTARRLFVFCASMNLMLLRFARFVCNLQGRSIGIGMLGGCFMEWSLVCECVTQRYRPIDVT